MTKIIWGLLLLLASSILAIGQSCGDEILNGTELRMDCGGESCPPCLHLMYEGTYNEVNELEIFVTIPPFDWSDEEVQQQGIYYELSNGFNTICTELGECQPFLTIQGGNDLAIDITKRNTVGDVLGYGRLLIESFCLSCQPLSASVNCDMNVELSMKMTRVPSDEGYYMLYAEMNDGVAPFRAFDNNYGLFYEDGIYESPFYLGRFPDSLEMDLTIFDAMGCRARIDKNSIINWESDTMQMDTVVSSIQEISSESIKLYPTIFTNEITIETSIDFNQIVITNANGELVYRETGLQGNNIRIATEALPSGIYFIGLQNETNRVVKRAMKF